MKDPAKEQEYREEAERLAVLPRRGRGERRGPALPFCVLTTAHYWI